MAYLKKTNLFKRILFSRPMALAIIFAIVFMGYGLFSLAGKSIDTSKARKLAETQAAALANTEATLSAKLTALDTPSGKEAVLREQFPVVKNGEHMVVISNEEPTTATDPASGEAENTKDGFWNFVKNLFN